MGGESHGAAQHPQPEPTRKIPPGSAVGTNPVLTHPTGKRRWELC